MQHSLTKLVCLTKLLAVLSSLDATDVKHAPAFPLMSEVIFVSSSSPVHCTAAQYQADHSVVTVAEQ